jgi:universal stress protein E
MSTSILVIIDPTAKSQPALDRAVWLAERQKSALELFICEYDQYLAGERFFDSKALEKARAGLLDRHRQNLEKLAKPIRDGGIEVSVDVAWDHPLHDGIVRKIEAAKPGLVMKDTHYHVALRRSIFSNTDWNVIRDCPAPLWLVKPHEDAAIKRIAAAVDPLHERDKPAQLDQKILRIAGDLVSATGAELHVVHAFDPAPVYAVSADAMSFPIAEPISEVIAELKKQHREALDRLVEGQPIEAANVHLVEGEARKVLTSIIGEIEADLAIMGAVSRGALKRLALGSTAEQILDFLPCDLLIIKPDAAG